MSTEESALQVASAPAAEKKPARQSTAQPPQVADSFVNFPTAPEQYSIDTAAAVLLALGKAH